MAENRIVHIWSWQFNFWKKNFETYAEVKGYAIEMGKIFTKIPQFIWKKLENSGKFFILPNSSRLIAGKYIF